MSTREFDPVALEAGTQIGHYVIESPLGHGGMGAVYKARRGNTEVAIKFAKRKLSELSHEEREHLESRLRREVSILFAVSHPGLVRIHAADRWPDLDGFFYIVTDLVPGKPWHEWQREAKPSLRKLCEALAEVADALAALHRAEFIHRDLKTDNIVVTADGRPVLIDFGIARQRHSYTVTGVGTLVGTTDYQSPEFCRFFLEGSAARGERYVYRATDDLHALGVVAYHAFAGRPPFIAEPEDEFSLLTSIANKVPPEPSSLNPALPHAVNQLVMKLLAKDPDLRFQSAGQLAEALDDVLQEADESWDAPYTPPLSEEGTPSRGRATASGRRRSRGAGSPRPGPAEPLVILPSAEEQKPAPQAGSGNTDTARRASPARAPGGFLPVTDERQSKFNPVEARAASAAQSKHSELHGLPSVIRRHAAVLKGQSSRGPTRTQLFAAGGVMAVALVLLLVVLSGRRPEGKPQSLLGEFEKARGEELASSAMASPAQPSTSSPLVVAPPEPALASPPLPMPDGAAAAQGATASVQQAAPTAPIAETRSPAPARGRSPHRLPEAAPAAGVAPAAASPAKVASGSRTENAPQRSVPAQVRCMVELRSPVMVAQGERGLPVEVLFRDPCYRFGDEEVVPDGSTAAGEATARDGRVVVQLSRLHFVGAEDVPVAAVAMQGELVGIAGTRSLRPAKAAGSELVAVATRLASDAVLSHLPSEAGQVLGAVQKQEPAGGDEPVEWVSLERGTRFQVIFQERQP